MSRGDPFDTGALRAGVLAAWADSPTRFREDANAEEDLRLGGYADTWCVELAQNAADAAARRGCPGGSGSRGRAGSELRVANTGAPLDAAGVTALAALRASAKRDDAVSVGRFGVGFAAVLALSDAPRVVTGGRRGRVLGGGDRGRRPRAARRRPPSWPAATASCPCCAWCGRRAGRAAAARGVRDGGPPAAAPGRRCPARCSAPRPPRRRTFCSRCPDLVEITVGLALALRSHRAAGGQTAVRPLRQRPLRPLRGGGVRRPGAGSLVRGTADGAADTATEQRGRHVRSFGRALPADPTAVRPRSTTTSCTPRPPPPSGSACPPG